MTEYQQLVRDSNGMPPVIRADYFEDHGYDLEADWLRRGENMPTHTVAGTDWVGGRAMNYVSATAVDINGVPVRIAVPGCDGNAGLYGSRLAISGVVVDGWIFGTGFGNGNGLGSDSQRSN